MSRLTTILIPLGILLSFSCFSQTNSDNALIENHNSTYQKRIQKERLYGVYIPKDLGDSFAQLNKLISKESKAKFKKAKEEIAIKKLHFSFGRWMIYNWGFYEGSRFSHYLRKLGIYDPDDMARFVMTTYHRNLNKKPLSVKQLIEEIQAKRLRIKEKRQREGTVISKTVRKVEKPKEQN